MFDSLNSRVKIQQRVATQSAIGETEQWIPRGERSAAVILIDAKTRSQYQHLNSEISHKIVFRTAVTLNLADYRFKHKSKTYLPLEPPGEKKDYTEILVKED